MEQGAELSVDLERMKKLKKWTRREKIGIDYECAFVVQTAVSLLHSAVKYCSYKPAMLQARKLLASSTPTQYLP